MKETSVMKLVMSILLLVATLFQFAYTEEDLSAVKCGEGRRSLTLQQRITAEGRYYTILRKLYVPQDKGDICNQSHYMEYGYWDYDYRLKEKYYKGHRNIPAGFWVYVYPFWYVWKDQKPF